ncbi:Tetrapyrrole biosynthesis [Quillaja saponaria]|uniref:Tetrapyrrole biosynthesis n=1 Tax=Quillaja saponaria TaxID=32244 RepID=A0AAD7Q0W6_QUISA|nr:Tetrapyrrole biosynthesis [Quillaja saponaria]
MAILPISYSIKVHQYNPISKARRDLLPHIVATSTHTVAAKPSSQAAANKSRKLIENSVLFDMFGAQHALTKDLISKEVELQGLEKEAQSIFRRLEMVVDRVIVLEINKFKRKIKCEMSQEEIILLDEMSREIVDKFLEQPIRFLRACDGNLEMKERIKELNLLVCMLEESTLTEEKMNIKRF